MNEAKKYTREFIYTCPSKVFDDKSLTINELKIYMMIRSFMDTTGIAYPSNNWIADKLGISRRRTIDNINKLVRKNYIERITVKGKRYLRIAITPIVEQIDESLEVTQTSPPSDANVTPPSDANVTLLDQSNINSKTIKKDKTRAREPEQELTTQAPSQDDYQETYYMQPASQPPATTSQDYGGYELTPKQQSDFERFWLLYPRKTSRARAAAQWFHDGCHLIADKIIEKLKEQIAKDASFLDGCVPNPHKYIVEKRYNDEIFKGKNQKGYYNYDDNSWLEEGKKKEEEFGF